MSENRLEATPETVTRFLQRLEVATEAGLVKWHLDDGDLTARFVVGTLSFRDDGLDSVLHLDTGTVEGIIPAETAQVDAVRLVAETWLANYADRLLNQIVQELGLEP